MIRPLALLSEGSNRDAVSQKEILDAEPESDFRINLIHISRGLLKVILCFKTQKI